MLMNQITQIIFRRIKIIDKLINALYKNQCNQVHQLKSVIKI